MSERDPQKIQNRMLSVTTSTREKWGKNGIETAGFWSRWLTWSFPTLKEAIKYIEKKYNVKINSKNKKLSEQIKLQKKKNTNDNQPPLIQF
jgi:rhamnogalacturonyl hydrolase YesR